MVFVNAGLPSLTNTLAIGDFRSAVRTLRRVGLISGMLLASVSLILLLIGPWILDVWTGNRVEYPHYLLAMFLLASILECAWLVLSMWIVAMNMQFTMATVYCCAVGLYLAALILLLPDGPLTLAPALQAAAMLIVLAYVTTAVLTDVRRKARGT
jgi:O-antigen/teichoic acid export membrane protein